MVRKDCCNGAYGTTFEAKRWMSMDPCGLVGVCSSASLHIFAIVVISTHLLRDSKTAIWIFICLYVPAVLMALSSLYMAWSSDPGAVPLGARPVHTSEENQRETISIDDNTLDVPLSVHLEDALQNQPRGIRRCQKCGDNFKPPRAHHDSVTGRCVVKMDHFCPWVGNVVGIGNHKFFVLFIFYTCLSALFSSILIVNRIIHCARLEGARTCQDVYTSFFFMLSFETILFFTFTVCMLIEQVETIQSNTSKIARLKLRQGGGKTNESPVNGDFHEMFGGNSSTVSWHWFVPTAIVFPAQYRDRIMGYVYDPSCNEIYFEEENDTENPEKVTETVISPEVAMDLHDNNDKYMTVKKRPSSRIDMEDESNLI